MDHKADEYWGTLLLAMAQDARQDGDLVTADVLFAKAMRYFDEASLSIPLAKVRGTP